MAQSVAWQEGTRHSGIAPRGSSQRDSSPPEAQSIRLWGLNWSEELPWTFGDDGVAEAATAAEALPFVAEHYPSIFGSAETAGRFLPSPMTEAKRRFFEEMDYFILKVGGEPAGLVMGHPADWTSYYVRSAAMLPRFRDRHLLTQFAERLYAPLRAVGVERIEAECSPANVPMGRLLSGQGYIVTASVTSERWGLMLRYTKYLTEDAQAAFVRQYTCMPFARRNAPTPPIAPRRTP